MGVKPHASVCCGHSEELAVVGVPLPLLAERAAVELIALLGINDGGGVRRGFAVAQYGFALLPHHGPAGGPVDRLQVDDAPIGPLVVEVEEPVLAKRRVNPGTLVGAIDVGGALPHHALPFVGPKGRTASHGQLPTHGHAPCRAHYPVPTLAGVELRAFGGVVLLSAVKHDAGAADGAGAVGRQFANGQHRVETGARRCPTVNQIAAPVVVPQWAGVNHALARNHANGPFPRACRVFGLHHENALVGVAPVDVEFTLVVADGRCPHAFPVLRLCEQRFRLQFGQGMADDFPVHQILGVQDGQSGNAVKGACREVVVLAHCTDIGVAVISIQYGVRVGSVSVVGTPRCRAMLRERNRGIQQHEERKKYSFHRRYFNQ